MTFRNDQVSQVETEKIVELARAYIRLEGDFVEMGCYKGDTSLLLAEVVYRGARLCPEVHCSVAAPKSASLSATPLSSPSIHAKPTSYFLKRLWIYDSFEGLPEKGEEDTSELGREFQGGELHVTKREVKERFLRAGLPVPVIKKAWFEELTEADLPERIAFAFLDGDFYQSIRCSLRLVENKMAVGGVIVVHDYNNLALPGVARAVDEWRRGRRVELEAYQSMAIIKC